MELWHGFRQECFEFEGRKAIVVFPETPDEKKNWTLKTEYWDAFPEAEVELLRRGFHVTWLENVSRLAYKADSDAKARFAAFLREKYGLRDKCVPVGMSFGGSCAINFAGEYPELVACLYLDAPVTNFQNIPGRFGDAECEEVWEKEFLAIYPGMKRWQMFKFADHPINKADILLEHNLPVLLVYGTQDVTVKFEEHGALLVEAYEEKPELMTVMQRVSQGHHPHGFPQKPEIIADYIVAHV